MTLHAPRPTPTGPVNDMDAGAFFAGVAFIAAGVIAWPALVLVYQIIVVFLGGGAVAPLLPSISTVLQLVAFALFTGFVSGFVRLKFRDTSRYLADLVEAVLGAASAGQITISAIMLNLAIGIALGIALSFLGVSSPFDVLIGSEALFATSGAIAIALGGSGSPPEWWDLLLMLLALLTLLGSLIGMLTAAIFAWVGMNRQALAGKTGSSTAAAIILSLTRLWTAKPNPAWEPEKPLPRAVGDLMTELELYEKEEWRREPRRDLLDNYRHWLIEHGHTFTLADFIENLPDHRDWLRVNATTQGQRYLGAFAERMRRLIDQRRWEIDYRERRAPIPKLAYSDGAPGILEEGEHLTYRGWFSTALGTGFISGLINAVVVFLLLTPLLIKSWM